MVSSWQDSVSCPTKQQGVGVEKKELEHTGFQFALIRHFVWPTAFVPSLSHLMLAHFFVFSKLLYTCLDKAQINMLSPGWDFRLRWQASID